MNKEELHLALIKDISDVIAKHLPNFENNIFENNIEAETWNLLPLFLDEVIHQLAEESKK